MAGYPPNYPNPYGYPGAPPAPGHPPANYPPPPGAYGSPYAAYPSAPPPPPQGPMFAPGTDPEIIRCFQMCDQDYSGFIDDKELQRALSSANHQFNMRTVRLLMFEFNKGNAKKIGPPEFTALWYSLQSWRTIFERFDRDRSGKIDSVELKEALLSMGYSLSPPIVDLIISKYDQSGHARGISYDNFIECSIIVKGLTEKFKAKDKNMTGSATFSYEEFMLLVLPFIVA
eukprot:TRINITY_DN2192_c0_g1_i1.p1 TRINITY_DN2192_c0_g1~~TRINITY_DN2192_c0_g1_i1.p1  ORF type:complete len:229 (+),score=21.86 TRINITY_DN2192_c0_g1_i1:367-1053(+)